MPISQDELKHYKSVETNCRRPLGDGVLHPDQCPSLKIKGVPWAIPPRGQRVAPSFAEDGSVVLATVTNEDWPEIEAVIQTVDLPDGTICKTCGQPTGNSAEVSNDSLAALFALAARAIRTQYELSDAELTELLAFESDEAPEWLTAILHWITGTTPQSGPEAPFSEDGLDWGDAGDAVMLLPESGETIPQSLPPTSKRRRRRRRRHKKGA